MVNVTHALTIICIRMYHPIHVKFVMLIAKNVVHLALVKNVLLPIFLMLVLAKVAQLTVNNALIHLLVQNVR